MALHLWGPKSKIVTTGESGVSVRLDVSARGDNRAFYVSRDNGQAYAWTGGYNSGNDETVLLLKNTSDTLDLVISLVEVASDAATRIRVHLTTDPSITPAGTEIKGINLNTKVAFDAQAVAKQNETNNSIGKVIHDTLIGANSELSEDFDHAIRLGQNKIIAIDQATGSTALATATIVGYFEIPGT